MSAGWVIVVIAAMFFATVLAVAAMLMHLYKNSEKENQ